MSAGGWVMVGALVASLGALAFVVYSMCKSIVNERTRGKSIWREFGLGIALMVLFFVTWIAHGVAEWQVYVDEQRSHGESTEIGDFVDTFAAATFENWQSEFLQLFAFVSLAALYVHKGSAESKDGDERIEGSLRRIEERLGTLPDEAPRSNDAGWKLPHPEDVMAT